MTASAAVHPTSSRDRLVQTTLDLLAEEGLEGLGLRSVARRAGLSHGAPLRHFQSFAELLSEAAAHGFQLLSKALEASAAGLAPGAGPLARLRAGSRAYVECAVANPALFALMFRPELLDVHNESYRGRGLAAFERVVAQVRAAQDAGWRTERDTRVLAGAIWASLHGLASLWAQGALAGPVPRASLDDALTTALDLLIGDAPGGDS
jgi:AcrR family transcriptional regulator